jgi:hypothetical protein
VRALMRLRVASVGIPVGEGHLLSAKPGNNTLRMYAPPLRKRHLGPVYPSSRE